MEVSSEIRHDGETHTGVCWVEGQEQEDNVQGRLLLYDYPCQRAWETRQMTHIYCEGSTFIFTAR